MPVDLDPIATLRRTDPASVHPVSEPPAPDLDELRLLAEPTAPTPFTAARSRIVALAATVVLVVALAGVAIVAGTRDDTVTPMATEPTPTTEPPGPDGETLRYLDCGDGYVRIDTGAADGEPLPDAVTPEDCPATGETDTEPSGGIGDRPVTPVEPPSLLPLADPTPARDALLALADRAAADATPITTGPIAYRRSVSWAQSSGGPGPGTGTTQRESWTGNDVAAVEEWAGPSADPGADVLTSLDPPRDADPVTSEWQGAYTDPVDLPEADPARIDLYLQVEAGPSSDFKYTLERAANLLGDRPRDGADRAAVLRRLAEIEQVQLRGEVVDRAGRTSLAFSVETDAHGGLVEVVVLLDPETGAFHGREDVLLEAGADETPLDGPAIQWTDTLLATANVATAGDRP